MSEARRWSVVPAGLRVGMVLGVASIWLGIAGQWFDAEHLARWNVLTAAGVTAGAWLAATGALELGRRLGAERARWAQLAAIGLGARAVAGIAALVVHYTGATEDHLSSAGGVVIVQRDLVGAWVQYQPYVLFGASLCAAIGLAGAAGLWRKSPALGAALAVMAGLAVPPPQVERLLYDALPGRRIYLFVAIASAAWMALALFVARRAAGEAAEPPEQHVRAVTGLRRAGVALWVRLGAASLLMATMSVHVLAVQRFTVLVSAVTGAVAMMLFAAAVVRVASASGNALPRVPLHLAAFLALWSAIVQSARALYLSHALDTPSGSFLSMFETGGPGWTFATPLMAAIGITVLLWSIARMAATTGDDKLHRTAMTTTKVYVIVMTISMLLVAAGGDAHQGQPAFLAIVFGSTVSVGALVMAASLCSKAATAIEARAPLATATLRSASDPA